MVSTNCKGLHEETLVASASCGFTHGELAGVVWIGTDLGIALKTMCLFPQGMSEHHWELAYSCNRNRSSGVPINRYTR